MAVRQRLADYQRLRAARPAWSEIESRWPGSVKTTPEGQREAKIPLSPDTAEGRRNRSDFLDMVAPSARLETEQSQERTATTDHREVVEARHERAGTSGRRSFGYSPAYSNAPLWRKRRRRRGA